jgi:hypothetical protein
MSNKHVVFAADLKKKKVDKEESTVLECYKSTKGSHKSYSFVMNDERGCYDILITTIDLETLEATVEVEKMRYDSEARAVVEIQKRVAEDVVRKHKRSR